MISRKWIALLAAAVVLASQIGCGGGGEGPVAVCGLNSFTPNYAHDVQKLLNWPGFPIRVFFKKDAAYTQARDDLARAGFNQWVTATGGKLTYTVVTSVDVADVQVGFDPTMQDGLRS